jgi:uncharacterized protein (DUF2267 family)
MTVDILKCWPSDESLVTVAVAAHGSSSRSIVYCGVRGWRERAVALAEHVRPEQADYVPQRWSSAVGGPVPAELRIALINAALAETSPHPDLASMSEREKQRALDRLRAEQTAHERVAWHLLESDILSACLAEITADRLRKIGDEFLTGVRLTVAAEYVLRPRLREIAAATVQRMLHEVIEDGWVPVGKYTGPTGRDCRVRHAR